MKNNAAVIALVCLLVGGGLGFFGGTQYQKGQRGQFGPRGENGTSGVRIRNGGSVLGEILSVDSNSITVKLPDGSSKIVLLTGSTSINKAAQGTVSDLSVGTRVAAFGTANADDSVTATNVQINPTP
jgi:hypothetical protein